MPSDPLPTAFFGQNFAQDTSSFTIFKGDLIAPAGLEPAYEFTPAFINSAESLLLALILKAQRNQDKSADSQLVITPFEPTLEYRYKRYQRVYTCQITVYIDDTTSTYPNPNSI
jgi:hypothetical protein